MEGKQIVRLTETIRYVSITLIAYWLYDFKINKGLGITKTFYYFILGILILMIGILLHLILKNQTSMFERHNKNVNRERVKYVSVILIFPVLAIILYGLNYYTKFKTEFSDFSDIPLYQDTQSKIIESQNYSIQDSSFISIIEKYKKTTTLLLAYESEHEINWTESKFGGYPNMEFFSEYPKCDVCKCSLNFVFQIFKKDFPEFYFPNDSNIFQLFRCPNDKCKYAYSNAISDHKMFNYYSKVDCKKNKLFVKVQNIGDFIEPEVPNCYLKSLKISDYPKFDDYKSYDLGKFNDNFKENLLDDRI